MVNPFSKLEIEEHLVSSYKSSAILSLRFNTGNRLHRWWKPNQAWWASYLRAGKTSNASRGRRIVEGGIVIRVKRPDCQAGVTAGISITEWSWLCGIRGHLSGVGPSEKRQVCWRYHRRKGNDILCLLPVLPTGSPSGKLEAKIAWKCVFLKYRIEQESREIGRDRRTN